MATAARGHDRPAQVRATHARRGRGQPEPERAKKLPDILQALDEEHHYQQRLLRLMEKQVAALNLRQHPDFEVMHGVMRYMTNYPDRFHHPKEDLVFGKVIERSPASRPAVEELLEEHTEIIARGQELLESIDRCRADHSRANADALRKSAHEYIGHLRRHMDAETLRFFPLAVRVLRKEDWANVDAHLQPVLDPVFGERPAPEFQSLRAHEQRSRIPVAGKTTRGGWVEAAAAMESLTALLAGATRASISLRRHNRATLGVNATTLVNMVGAESTRRRIELAREACALNGEMARDFGRQLAQICTEAIEAARRPYQAKKDANRSLLTRMLGMAKRPVPPRPAAAATAAK